MFCLVLQVYVPNILELIEMSPVNSDLQLGALRLLTNLSVTDQHQHLLKTSIRLLLSLLVVGNEALQVCFHKERFPGAVNHLQLFLGPVKTVATALAVFVFQVQSLKVLVNLSSNPDMMEDIVQAQVRIKIAGSFFPTTLCKVKYRFYNTQDTSRQIFFPPLFLSQAPASVVLLFDAQTATPVLLRLLTFAGNLRAWRPSTQVADILRQKQDCLFRVMLDESSQLNNRLFQLLSHPDGEIQARVARILT